ncbi:MAG TPA: helix-turn-helix domain-containing protein [Candidatus Polarisedimenticolaceae bacterium]|nr:helix-turn-helix domain-containing protein [Candidatus Polarisedimenticolaceae bacterium]
MNEEIISQVEELGLSNKESRVYLANLMLGPAGVQQIADASGIKRVTTYVILESLVNLGLVSQTAKAKKTLFNAESPENLRRLLQRREQSLHDQKQQLDDLMPELKSLKTLPKDAPVVKLYDSAEGLRTVMKTVIDEAKAAGEMQLYGMSNVDQFNAFFPEIAAGSSNPERVRAGIACQYIYTSNKGPVYPQVDKANNRVSRYVPIEKYPLNGDMTVIGNNIALMSMSGSRPLGVIIKSNELSRSMRGLFLLAWEGAAKHNPN